MHLSSDYFSRAFRATVGQPPRTWLAEQRIQSAAAWLRESDLNVSEIADAMGYSDVFLFSQQFKKYVGVSPSTYRRSGPGRPIGPA